MIHRTRVAVLTTLCAACSFSCSLRGAEQVDHPFPGITSITRTEADPRSITVHIVKVDLSTPGIGFKVTPPGSTLETVRQTTLDFLKQEHAQVAINAHYFLPFPSKSPDAVLVGFAASNGHVYSAFETPAQSYAIVANAPAINIDPSNHATIVHNNSRFADGKHVQENVTVWNALAGSAQIVTGGLKTIPAYADSQNPGGLLVPGGPRKYSNTNSWYDAIQARTAIGLSRDGTTLFLIAVDCAGRSLGMKVGEVADLLIRDYDVSDALNLDGGGSTTMAMENPVTHAGAIVNVSSDNPNGRSVGSNLAVFASSRR